MNTVTRASVICFVSITLTCTLSFASAAPPRHAPPLAQPRPTLAQMVGALLLVGFDGARATDVGVTRARAMAEKGAVAGFIFYSYNIESPEQTRALITHMRTWSSPRPLILALDQEGGRVSRLAPSKGFAAFPCARDAAMAGDPTVYEAMADLVADMGFDLNLGPVVDLAVNPEGPAIGAMRRAFGDDVATVTRWAGHFIQAHRKVGVRTALKHFPGHGSAADDSHQGLTDVTASWSAEELQPFYELVNTRQVDAIMSAHLSHRGIDTTRPLSLSPDYLTRALRDCVHFEGPIISDALDMGALYHHHAFEDVVVGALQAGHDFLIFSHNGASHGRASGYAAHEDLPEAATRAVEAAIEVGALDHARLCAAYRRATLFARQPSVATHALRESAACLQNRSYGRE